MWNTHVNPVVKPPLESDVNSIKEPVVNPTFKPDVNPTKEPDVYQTNLWLFQIITPANKSEKFLQVLKFWWLALRNFQEISQEQVFVTDSWEILEKFFRIGAQFKRFLRDQSFENSWDFLRNFPKKFLRFFLESFSGNFWKFLRNFSLEYFQNISSELGHQFYWFLLDNFTG